VQWSRAGPGRSLEKTWNSEAVGSHLHQHEAGRSSPVPLSATCRSTSWLSLCHSLVDMVTPLHNVIINQVLLLTATSSHGKTMHSLQIIISFCTSSKLLSKKMPSQFDLLPPTKQCGNSFSGCVRVCLSVCKTMYVRR